VCVDCLLAPLRLGGGSLLLRGLLRAATAEPWSRYWVLICLTVEGEPLEPHYSR
jgi:hypothetical protein